MKKAELVFFPCTGAGHLASTLELAKRLITHDDRLSVTVLLMDAPFETIPHGYTESVTASFSAIRFIQLPTVDPPPPDVEFGLASISVFIQNHKQHVERTISKLISSSSVPLSGLVVDMFTTTMIPVAHQLGIPSYVYITTGAAALGFMLYFPTFQTHITTHLKDYESQLDVPSFINSVPPLVLPDFLMNGDGDSYTWFLHYSRMLKEAKGVIVNSFTELEPHAVQSLTDGRTPPVYPVGPLLDLEGQTHSRSDPAHLVKIMNWLDDQASSSVIFLCFGSRGAFGAPQVREIAVALERSGHRFLWSLRRPPTTKMDGPSDYTNPDEVLPSGFLKRTEGRGLVCGWTKQVAILGHKAIGCFVSHCGWNSILESLWFGVPILTWPLYAEQKLNSFVLARELGLAVEIRSDDIDGGDLIMAEEIEMGVRRVMELEVDNEVRRKTKEMKENSRKTIMEGGSSFTYLERFIKDLKL